MTKGKAVTGEKAVFITLGLATTLHITTILSFVIPSEAEGSAVLRTFRGNVLKRSAVFLVLTQALEPLCDQIDKHG
jgi:hypothetical protein